MLLGLNRQFRIHRTLLTCNSQVKNAGITCRMQAIPASTSQDRDLHQGHLSSLRLSDRLYVGLHGRSLDPVNQKAMTVWRLRHIPETQVSAPPSPQDMVESSAAWFSSSHAQCLHFHGSAEHPILKLKKKF